MDFVPSKESTEVWFFGYMKHFTSHPVWFSGSCYLLINNIKNIGKHSSEKGFFIFSISREKHD